MLNSLLQEKGKRKEKKAKTILLRRQIEVFIYKFSAGWFLFNKELGSSGFATTSPD